MEGYYLWFKALHIVFMVTWFAGLFYLPRLFIYHAEAGDGLSRDRFVVMERRLFAIMTIGAALTIVFGVLLLAVNKAPMAQGWFHAKLGLLAGLIAFHASCRIWMAKLAAGYATSRTTALRWYNEVPVLFLVGIIVLAVIRPF